MKPTNRILIKIFFIPAGADFKWPFIRTRYEFITVCARVKINIGKWKNPSTLRRDDFQFARVEIFFLPDI